ncbi:relaxase/mobilization nuclease domain-containing protein (plasmid) [Leisingera aquaemixtae]|uniref:Relaxase/mobilization nuclease domain-containing protein n=1 Tax=Leisingera aquaemixtae TaxID=1396826 RepID=A0ABY5WR95_9RHOB|nr:relaxase/mobilization nuclease domain-containing protein [Leisingera aquaemixtae]UWQ44025.1 relaxase/mobilization nuclease domain-containing protein [Leisingera aquaemixtae]
MSDFKTELGFQDCWAPPARSGSVKSPASGYFSTGGKPSPKGKEQAEQAPARQATTISAADKARLARVVNKTPEVMVKVSKPAKVDKSGNTIVVNRRTEGIRVRAHLDYISRNGKLDIETSDGAILTGKAATAALYHDWMKRHDEDRDNGDATDRTRITTSIVFSMPGNTNATAVKDAVRALAENEFGGRHDYAMALHTDTKHPHVHLTVRTVGNDGVKLNLRKADLQHLRDVFAEKLRQRGIEAESTPRHARGVTRKGERTPVYKMRQRGKTPYVDKAKQREVRRDLQENGGRMPSRPWDGAIVERRNRVMRTYSAAAALLAESHDPEDRALGRAVAAFSGRLTDVTTERGAMALRAPVERSEKIPGAGQKQPEGRGRVRERDEDEKRPEQSRGPPRER